MNDSFFFISFSFFLSFLFSSLFLSALSLSLFLLIGWNYIWMKFAVISHPVLSEDSFQPAWPPVTHEKRFVAIIFQISRNISLQKSPKTDTKLNRIVWVKYAHKKSFVTYNVCCIKPSQLKSILEHTHTSHTHLIQITQFYLLKGAWISYEIAYRIGGVCVCCSRFSLNRVFSSPSVLSFSNAARNVTLWT